jgi:hypothetical protein
MFTNRTALFAALVAGVAGSACGAAPPDPGEGTGTVDAEQAATSVPLPGTLPELRVELVTLHTYIPQSLEIDQSGAGAPRFADANLFTGPDPVDLTPSVRAPRGASPVFVDWNDLGGDTVADHRVLDTAQRFGSTYADRDAFGTATGACLVERPIPSSVDVTYVAAANNQRFAYLAAQRADHDYDAELAFLFTQAKPSITPYTPCPAGGPQMRFTLTAGGTTGGGDVLLVGHFVPDAGPLFRAYVAVRPAESLDPTDAIDPAARWVEVQAIEAAAANVTRTAPGSFGAEGVVTPRGVAGVLDPHLFVEVAIPIDLFARSGLGHRAYYLTVFSRARVVTASTPLVDVVGPALIEMMPPVISFPYPPLPAPWIPHEDPLFESMIQR